MARRRSRRSRSRASKNIVGALLILGAFSIMGVGIYEYLQMQASRVSYDLKTNCPLPIPESVTVVLIDQSERFNAIQSLYIRNQLEKVKVSIPRNGAIVIYTFGGDREEASTQIIKVCNPGRPEEVDPLIESPLRAAKKWENAFNAPLQAVFEEATALTETNTTPIFEAIQNVSVGLFQKPDMQNVPKRLVIVSDMLHHVEAYSHYRDNYDFSEFRRSEYYRKVKTDLNGVDVTILYVQRSTKNRLQGKRHLEFWAKYFVDQGVSGLRILRVEG